MNYIERISSICVYTLQAATTACFLTNHLSKNEDVSHATRQATFSLSALTIIFIGVVSLIKMRNQPFINKKKTLLYSGNLLISAVSVILNVTLFKPNEQISIIALSCISIMQCISFISCFILFELPKLCIPISQEEEEALRLLQTQEPESPLALLISKMQLEQDQLNKLKAGLQLLEYTYRNTNSPDLLNEINDTTAAIQKSTRKIQALRMSIQTLDASNRLPPPPYSPWLNPNELRLDSNLSNVSSSTETTIEREKQIHKLERTIRHRQFELDILNLKLNTEGLLEEEKISLLLEREKLNELIKKAKEKLHFLLEPSILPAYSQHSTATTTV